MQMQMQMQELMVGKWARAIVEEQDPDKWYRDSTTKKEVQCKAGWLDARQ